ncbi:hypothetical protein ACI797_10100 [Geodermatophilus sp. SYSU D00691]
MTDQTTERTARFLRVKVVDHTKDGSPAVNIKVPLGVVKWGMKMAQAFTPQMRDVELDWDSVNAMVQDGETGKVVEVEDEAEQKTVEVWLE